MDGAGQTIFERIESKLSGMGIHVDNSDLRNIYMELDAKVMDNPEDKDSKVQSLELKVLEIARLLEATIGALESGAHPHACVCTSEEQQSEPSPRPAHQSDKIPAKGKKFRINAATGIIEQVEDRGDDNVIVADGKPSFGGRGGDPKKEKKCVFIAAVDDDGAKPEAPAKKR